MHRSFDRGMPDVAFRLMSAIMAVEDWIRPTLDRRVATFGIREGMTLVDYGCGPGRYTTRFAKVVGDKGKVYAIDVQPLAIKAVKRKMAKEGLNNIVPTLARGYESGLAEHSIDMVCALDMFFGLSDPSRFLQEVQRITKASGVLVVDDGHESRQATLAKIAAFGSWRVAEETADHLKCVPAAPSKSNANGTV